jgi:hypothetical protein
MLNLVSIVLQYLITAADPSWSCELIHRDSGVTGTYYLYCQQTTRDGVELVQVGRFVADRKPLARPVSR